MYIGANLIICTVFWGAFNTWRVSIRAYLFQQSKFGTARYAKPEELKPFTNKKGFYIGGDYTFREKGHLLTVAGTRSGKFVSLIAPNLLGMGGYEDSWVVVDPKGEATAVTARYQMNRDNRRVVILNPWGEHSDLVGETDAYNPLDILKDRNSIHLVDDAAMIAEMIIPVEKSDKDKFFADNARSILTGLLLHLVTTANKSNPQSAIDDDQTEERQQEPEQYDEGAEVQQNDENAAKEDKTTVSWLDIVAEQNDKKQKEDSGKEIVPLGKSVEPKKQDRKNFGKTENTEYEEAGHHEENDWDYTDSDISLKTIWEWIRLPRKEWEKLLEDMWVNDDEVNGDIVKKAGHEIMKLMASGERTFGIIMAYLLQATDFIKSPSLQNAMKSDFDPKTLSDGNVTMYVIIPADKLVSHFRWLRLVVTTAMRAVIRNKNRQVCFLLDEFAALGFMPEIEMALSTYAGYNITLWPILQSLVQLNSVYEKNWESFIGNTAVKQFFGVNDNFTADYVSKSIGMASHTRVERNLFRIKDVVANQRLLVTPDEIRRGSADNMFVFIKSLPVTVIKKQPYYEMSELFDGTSQRFDSNPYYKAEIEARTLEPVDRAKLRKWLIEDVEHGKAIIIESHSDGESVAFARQIQTFIQRESRDVQLQTGNFEGRDNLEKFHLRQTKRKAYITVYKQIDQY